MADTKQQAPDLPVYLFTGFLEAGKTKFIQETLEDERFHKGERTLLLLCEEGEEVYEPDKFCAGNVYVRNIDEESDLTVEHLKALQDEIRPERVLVEFNGMWMLDSLYGNLPEGWAVAQEFLFCDATSFLSYNANMRQLMVDKLKSAELVVLNRYNDSMDRMEMHRIIRAISRRCDIAYEYPDGKVVYSGDGREFTVENVRLWWCNGHGDGTARALPLDDERTQALKDVRCADGIQRAYGFGVDYDVGVLRQPLVYSDAAERLVEPAAYVAPEVVIERTGVVRAAREHIGSVGEFFARLAEDFVQRGCACQHMVCKRRVVGTGNHAVGEFGFAHIGEHSEERARAQHADLNMPVVFCDSLFKPDKRGLHFVLAERAVVHSHCLTCLRERHDFGVIGVHKMLAERGDKLVDRKSVV